MGAILAAVALLGLMVPTGVATGQSQSVETSTLPDAGVLSLKTGAEDHFRFQPTSGPPSTQSINVTGQCQISLGGAALVQLTATGGPQAFPGFFADGIGVGSRSQGNGQPCGRVDGNETLTMQLLQGNGNPLRGKFIDYAEIDIEGKFGVTVIAELYFNSTKVGEERLVTAEGRADSGPDSGDGDNFRWRLPKNGKTVFNKLVLKAEGGVGAFSLEGGADGTQPCNATTVPGSDCATFSLGETLGTNDSLFHLVEADGVLGCTTGNNTVTSGGNGTPTNTLVRQQNADGSPCVLIPFNLDQSVDGDGTQFVLLQKNLIGQGGAQFYWTIQWTHEDAEYPITRTTQWDYGDSRGFHDAQWCDPDTDGDGYPNLPPNEFWCLVSQDADLDLATGLITVTEVYYGRGDPAGKR